MTRHAIDATAPIAAVAALAAAALASGCAARPETSARGTLAELRRVQPDVVDVEIDQGLEQAMDSYRRFLEETPETEMTPEAMRRLADLQLEKQFGLRAGDGRPREMAAPQPVAARRDPQAAPMAAPRAGQALPAARGGDAATTTRGVARESDQEFEARTTAAGGLLGGDDGGAYTAGPVPGGEQAAGALEAIALYDRLLREYPAYEHNDQVLYQMARAYDELGRTEEAMATMERLIAANPHSVHLDEVQFRRGEYFFTRRKFLDAEEAYGAILALGTASTYHELALYKLGWTFYKQDLYEEALHRYMALLDYKVSIGYDFDEAQTEDDERRVTDTYRVISFSFSNLGGPEAVGDYFARFGSRSYEDRVYRHLGEHYLGKLRYDDAARTYRAFIALYPTHRAAPRFSMDVVETFTQGGFPMLVLESKRDFAARYGLQAEYWRHFNPEERPEVLAFLKTNLRDLATHYHARYQEPEDEADKAASYQEARRWYGDYLASFPTEPDTPPISYRLADLLLEHEEFGAAARQYEQTAYGYEPHPQAAAAGYAAVYAYREQLKGAGEAEKDAVKRDTVASSLRFADAFPDHESAPAILGAAADDLYQMKDHGAAIAAAQRLIDSYPAAEAGLRRAAWIVVAHGSFELAEYARAEQAYGQVLAATPETEPSRAGFMDNLAASIYKQGEIARQVADHRTAADHFLRVRASAPTSTIRATAEYDAGAALMELEDWTGAAGVLESFRGTYPDHELALEATRLLALAYREAGQLARAADEYDRIAGQSDDPAVRGEALLVAGDLYEQSGARQQALDVYRRYVDAFPAPVETALETRLKMAELHKAGRDQALYERELAAIVCVEADAGAERSVRTRTIASRSALTLAEKLHEEFLLVRLRQPFEVSLQEKKQRMDAAIEALEHLVTYEIAEVTAAATFYMGETYLDFSLALAGSQRPADLSPAELEEYELVLEEEAFPFEEKAIDLHEANLELMHAGVFNAWTERSLGKLAELVPGRYARQEMSSGYPGALDTYEYRSPAMENAPQADPGPAAAAAPQPSSTAGRHGAGAATGAGTRPTGSPAPAGLDE